MVRMERIFRHLVAGRGKLYRAFPKRLLRKIEDEIKRTEANHNGQIRFVAEHALDIWPLFAGMSARERALDVFSMLRIWDTEQNNGVLIYLLLADRDVEIVADRGIHRRSGEEVWEGICREMEAAFREGRYEEGVLNGIKRVGAELERHFPSAHAGNELPDKPVLI